MGILISCNKVSMEWPGKRVLKDQSLGVYEGDRIGIVGRNGDGKTTLIELLGHQVEPDSGTITWRNNISVGMLGQSDGFADDDIVSHVVVGDIPEYEWASDARIREIIDALLAGIPWEGRVGELSGGQRRRVDLARLLIERYDVLLLDEPTNHLDLKAINWLAGHLKARWPQGQGALLLVTHDRWFLDEICQTMWEVHSLRVSPFEGGYSAYIQQRVERDRQAAAAEVKRQNIMRKELNWLAHGPKARTSKPKFRLKEARELIADDPPLRNSLELKRLAVTRLGKQVIELKDAGFAYGDEPVLRDIEWIVGPGDRYAILGENGVGKSTLLKLMRGIIQPTQGSVKIGKSVRFGLLSQDLDSLADKDGWRVKELLNRYQASYVIDGKEVSATQLLERLGFDTKETMTPVGELSGGQRRRLAIMCVLLEGPNVLILDEPGNDLDTDMLAVLEDLLDTWPGTLLLVSHDRNLVERVTDDQFALIDGRVRHVPGGVDEYLELVAGAARGATPSASAKETAPGAAQPAGLSNKERQQAKRRIEAVSRLMAKAEERATELRAQLASADQSDYQELERLMAQIAAADEEASQLETEWLELDELLGGDS